MTFALKTLLIVTLAVCALSQGLTGTTAPAASKTFPNPDPSWTEYQVKSCCPRGFYEVLNYCVRCTAPNIYDAVDQRCKP